MIEFDSYAAFFTMTPQSQVEVSRRVCEGSERNVAKHAKAPPSPRRRLREGQLEPRMLYAKEALMLDFESYAAFFALSPETQAEVDRRMREDVERIAAKQAEAEL